MRGWPAATPLVDTVAAAQATATTIDANHWIRR
jgi:hypothetical protein